MEEKYIICEDSLEGIFTAIYDAYALREGHEHIHIQTGEEDNYRLFAVYLHSCPDYVKTNKVIKTLKSRLGDEVYLALCRAAASCDPGKGEAVYRTVVEGITAGSGRRTMDNLRDPYVARTHELARRTANEAHKEIEFLRFGELEGGILYARIGPENNVMAFIMPHFADRLPTENFLIHDEKRDLYGVHPANKDWYLVSGAGSVWQSAGSRDAGGIPAPGGPGIGMRLSGKERRYRDLFALFHETIAIGSRRNKRLQQQMLPLRFQEYMFEFSPR